ncbi:hypothetical protein ACFVAV_02250 [Nocardia sp. NPDC057663]|uniref:hypothetical protein n=1 Tax=Nocardia sp. NPDC057663 TaxID=3346201 RepID=UPI00366B55E5
MITTMRCGGRSRVHRDALRRLAVGYSGVAGQSMEMPGVADAPTSARGFPRRLAV